MSYPQRLEIVPFMEAPDATVRVPGSKSITNRALVLAALGGQAGGTCELRGVLQSEDTEVMIQCLEKLGFILETHWPEQRVRLRSMDPSRLVPAKQADLFVANSGTTMRFLTALVSLGIGRFRLDGVPRMRERPIADLLGGLRELGVRAWSEQDNGCPPVVVEASGLPGGSVEVKGDVSSQYLSALLMAAPLARGPLKIAWKGPYVSRPYVDMTVAMMRQFGIEITCSPASVFAIAAPQRFQRIEYTIEPDASAASYFWAAAAILGGRVTVAGLPRESLQGDVGFVNVLEKMGCGVARDRHGWTVQGRALHGVDIDMNDISDTVMTLAAVACFADGPTTIRHVAHIRHKETDRLAALAAELRRVGAAVEERADGLTITPGPLHGAVIETYNDHRMAMSMALVGLRVPGIVLDNPGCVAKTYPAFFQDLDQLRR